MIDYLTNLTKESRQYIRNISVGSVKKYTRCETIAPGWKGVLVGGTYCAHVAGAHNLTLTRLLACVK